MNEISQEHTVNNESREMMMVQERHRKRSTLVAGVVGCIVGLLVSSDASLMTWSIGIGAVFGVGFIVRRNQRNVGLQNESQRRLEVSLYNERKSILVGILRAHGTMSFENLKDQSQFMDQALIPTLQRMVHDGLVDEELTVDTGKWKYKLSSNFDKLTTQESIEDDINQRMQKLKMRDHFER